MEVPFEIYRRHTYEQAKEIAMVTPLTTDTVSYYWWLKLYYPHRILGELNVYTVGILERDASTPPAAPPISSKDGGK